MFRKSMIPLLAAAALSLAASGVVAATNGAAKAEWDGKGTFVFTNDGTTTITDAAFDAYFKGGAADGVAALLDSGAVYVNGVKVPATEDETVSYEVNGLSCLYKTASGWGYNVHKTTSANNLSFKNARLGFIQTISTVRGHTVTLSRNDEGRAAKIDATSLEVVRIANIDTHGGSTEVDRGVFALETNRIRPDINKIIFPGVNIDPAIAMGDVAVYWFGENGWNLRRAVPVNGTLAKDAKTNEFVIGGKDSRIESNVSRYNLFDANRPTQFFTAYTRLGLGSVSVTTWCTGTGHPIGFTYGDKKEAKTALALAIKNATAAKEGVVVSADGTDVVASKKWVTRQAMDEYDAAIAAAQKVYNNNLSSGMNLDQAIYDLSSALGNSGNKPSGFIGSQGEGSK
jgi:hypothetical protein